MVAALSCSAIISSVLATSALMVLYRPPKRARVQHCSRVENFGTSGYPADYSGAFRSNIKSFLNDFAQPMPLQMPGVRKWCVHLHADRSNEPVSLFVLEELPFESGVLHCNHCRIIGWGHHPVCRARYHFILPAAEGFEAPGVGKGRKLCNSCGSVIGSCTLRCPECGLSATKTSVLEARSHLLHGILHMNGYGHLLRVNGHEAGSRHLSGREIMDLWDRICNMLRARKVSVLDVSKKFGLNLRLLHAVARGESWYSMWGYRFGRGSFGISEISYRKAVRQVTAVSLNVLALTGSGMNDDKLDKIISCYQKLSEASLSTLQDLVQSIVDNLKMLKRRNRDVKCPVTAGSTVNSFRWSKERLNKATEVLLTVLKSFPENKWLLRQHLREKGRVHIGDTGLLDHTLYTFVGKIVDGKIVERQQNSQLRQLEYRLTDVVKKKEDDVVDAQEMKVEVVSCVNGLEEENVQADLSYLYEKVMEGKGLDKGSELGKMVMEASRVILDSKHFIKDYRGNLIREENMGDTFRVQCRIEMEELEKGKNGGAPSELVVLEKKANVGDLKSKVRKAFSEVYPSYEKMSITSIPVLESVEDDEKLRLVEGMMTHLTMKGICGVDDDKLTEKGKEEWIVECECGVVDDDGERMGACDVCGVWSHTRCAGIDDCEPVPHQFLCHRHRHRHRHHC